VCVCMCVSCDLRLQEEEDSRQENRQEVKGEWHLWW
jgi:hypothetical protein